jgi:hypothetical protein
MGDPFSGTGVSKITREILDLFLLKQVLFKRHYAGESSVSQCAEGEASENRDQTRWRDIGQQGHLWAVF